MAKYFLEVEKRRNEWAVFLWRSTWFGGNDIIHSEYRHTKEEIDESVKMITANKDRYIKEYEDGLNGHKIIPL